MPRNPYELARRFGDIGQIVSDMPDEEAVEILTAFGRETGKGNLARDINKLEMSWLLEELHDQMMSVCHRGLSIGEKRDA